MNKNKLSILALSIVFSSLTVNADVFDINLNNQTTATATSAGGYGANMRGSVNDYLYYSIGGGSVLSAPPSHNKMQKIGVGVTWSSDLMCGNFDLETTVKNQLNGATKGFQDMMSNVINSATGAVASLPALAIQRANPGLYELLTNGMLQANISFDKAQLTCQKMSEKMMDYAGSSKGPFTQLAIAEEFKNIVNLTGDAVQAEQDLNKTKGTKGIPWIGNVTKGGVGQPAIKPTYDITSAGYNILNNQPVTNAQKIDPNDCNGWICQKWSTPEEAAKAVVEVLGDGNIKTCTDPNACNGQNPNENANVATSGVGFSPMLDEITLENQKLLIDLVNGTLKPNDENLSKIKSGGLPVSRNIIQALKDDPDNAALVQRLSSELAFSETITTGLAMRRLLMSGLSDPNVAALDPATEIANDKLAKLDQEINALKTEMDIRKSIANNSLLTTLERQDYRNQQNKAVSKSPNTNKSFTELSAPTKTTP